MRFVLWLLIINFIFLGNLSAEQIWEKTNGPYAGNCYGIGITSKNNIFVGTGGGKVYRSKDSTKTWELLPVFDNLAEVKKIVVTPNDVIYVVLEYSYIYKSTDEGETWVHCDEGLNGHSFDCFGVSPLGNLYIGAGNYLYISTDEGQTWDIDTHFEYNSPLNIAFNSKNEVFVGHEGYGLLRKTEGDTVWTNLSSGIFKRNSYFDALAINSNDDIYVYPSDYLQEGNKWVPYGNLYKSTDNGISWKEISELENKGIHDIKFFNNNDVGVTSYYLFWLGTENGKNWSQQTLDEYSRYVYEFAIFNDNLLIAPSYHNGVVISTNRGKNWSQSCRGISDYKTTSITSDDYGSVYACVYGNGIFKTTDHGNTWSQIMNELINFTYNLGIDKEGYLYAATFSNGIVKSTDDGNTWFALNNGIDTSNFWCTHIESSLVFKNESEIYAPTDCALFYSSNSGDNWEVFHDGLSLGFGISNQGTIFYSYSDGQIHTIYSTDNGMTWIDMTEKFPRSFFIFQVTLSGRIFVLFDDYNINNNICYSDNDGKSWQSSSNGIIKYNGRIVARGLTSDKNGNLYLSCYPGAYCSNDDGYSWQTMCDGLETTEVFNMHSASDGYLYAGTYHNTIYRTIEPITSCPNNEQENSKIKIYPNPASDYIEITALDCSNSIKQLNIYNMLSECVVSINQNGLTKYRIDISGLTPGIYYVQVGNFVEKFMIVR